jgi:hypothetical protein
MAPNDPTQNGRHTSNLALLASGVNAPDSDASSEVLDDDDQDDDDQDDDDELTEAEAEQILATIRARNRAKAGLPPAGPAQPAPAPIGQAQPYPAMVAPPGAIVPAPASAIAQLRAEAQLMPVDTRPQQSMPVHPGMVAPMAAPMPSLDATLTSVCHTQGDVVLAEALWMWLAKRRAELTSAGLHGLSSRWDLVQHALSSGGGFTKGEWGAR